MDIEGAMILQTAVARETPFSESGIDCLLIIVVIDCFYAALVLCLVIADIVNHFLEVVIYA